MKLELHKVKVTGVQWGKVTELKNGTIDLLVLDGNVGTSYVK